VLVIGGTLFIGQTLVKQLLHAGHEVIGSASQAAPQAGEKGRGILSPTATIRSR
jgi:nucleoside-diphosphate-sugar epimerase